MTHLAIITHPSFSQHEMGDQHPESPKRLQAIERSIQASDLKNLRYYEANAATLVQLIQVHDSEYIQKIFQNAPKEGYLMLDPDTAMNPFSLTAALHAAGALVQATDLVMTDQEQVIFCLVRPPGHHATRDQAMGFCFFNNVAVGVSHALTQYHLNKIAIVDFDVHNGNGTIDIFQNDPRVLYISSFQSPFYPYMSTETDNDHIINIPLKAGAGSKEFREKMQDHCLTKLAAFKPELIYISAGFDAHKNDPLANLNLAEDDYYWITHELNQLAKRYCHGRMISTLEGGYNLSVLGESVLAHLRGMIGLNSGI